MAVLAKSADEYLRMQFEASRFWYANFGSPTLKSSLRAAVVIKSIPKRIRVSPTV